MIWALLSERSRVAEIIDDPALPEAELAAAHRSLRLTHRWLGNTAAILSAIRRDPKPVRQILDIGCGHGGVAWEIKRRLQAEVIGIDLRPPAGPAPIPIIAADAIRSPLPPSDVAIALCLAHHLSEEDLADLLRNVGRYCRRFIVVDLVRHRLPRILFRLFVAPWVHPIAASDGVRSIERSFTASELPRLAADALRGSGARIRHSVAPLYMRQIIDISYRD